MLERIDQGTTGPDARAVRAVEVLEMIGTAAAKNNGYHPFPRPSANASRAYTNPDGSKYGACQYCGYCQRFGCEANAKGSPLVSVIPYEAATPALVIVGFLILAGAVNTAIIGSNGVLNRVAEDGVMPEWFLKPHPYYGTTYRILTLIVIPAIYGLVKEFAVRKEGVRAGAIHGDLRVCEDLPDVPKIEARVDGTLPGRQAVVDRPRGATEGTE